MLDILGPLVDPYPFLIFILTHHISPFLEDDDDDDEGDADDDDEEEDDDSDDEDDDDDSDDGSRSKKGDRFLADHQLLSTD